MVKKKKFNKRQDKCSHKEQMYIQGFLIEDDNGKKFMEYHFFCKKCYIIHTIRTNKPIKSVQMKW